MTAITKSATPPGSRDPWSGVAIRNGVGPAVRTRATTCAYRLCDIEFGAEYRASRFGGFCSERCYGRDRAEMGVQA